MRIRVKKENKKREGLAQDINVIKKILVFMFKQFFSLVLIIFLLIIILYFLIYLTTLMDGY